MCGLAMTPFALAVLARQAYPTTVAGLRTNFTDGTDAGDETPGSTAVTTDGLADTINKHAVELNALETALGNPVSSQGAFRPCIDICARGFTAAGNKTTNGTIFTNALTEAASYYGSVYVRPATATYPVTNFTIPSDPFELWGGGASHARLYLPDATSGAGLYLDTTISPTTTDPFPTQVHYVHDLGFDGPDTGTAWGWYIQGWSTTKKVNFWAERCIVRYFGGGGVYCRNSGQTMDAHLSAITACQIAAGPGFMLGSDLRAYDLVAFGTYQEGFYWDDGRNSQLIGGKAWDTGKAQTAGRTAGMHIEGGGQSITNFYAQDTVGPGVYIHNANNVEINTLVCDRTNAQNTDGVAGLTVADSHDLTITNYSVRKTNNTYPMANGLLVTDSGGHNWGNKIQMSYGRTVDGYYAITPVDPASNLSGTNVEVGGSGGGRIVAASAATVTPDPYLAQHNVYTLGGNITTVAAPANAHDGCLLRLTFVQDATGGRTIPTTFAAAYVMRTIAASGGALTRLSILFEYSSADAKWVQTSPQITTAAGWN